MKQQQKLHPVAKFEVEDKIMFLPKQPNKKVPLEFMLHTYIYKGKDYPYNSTKRGWIKVDA